MEKASNASLWIEEGYSFFANEGPNGIQVERLARVLKLNKSGFYHYFGDMDGYYEKLLEHHQKMAQLYLEDIRSIGTIDPEYLHLLVQYKVTTLFHMQLLRNKDNPAFMKRLEMVDNEERVVLQDLWSDFLGLHDKPTLAMQYFDIVNAMFYARIRPDNFDYPFLQTLSTKARDLVQEVVEKGHAQDDISL